MIKALIRERTLNVGLFDAIQWIIYEYEEISGAVHVQPVLETITPVDEKELVSRQTGGKMLEKQPVDCYTFLARMGDYNHAGKLQDIRASEYEHEHTTVGHIDGTHSHVPPAGSGDKGMYAYQPTTDFEIAEPKDEE